MVTDPGAIDGAITDVLALHRLRSSMATKVAHPDVFRAPTHGAFVRDVLARLAADRRVPG